MLSRRVRRPRPQEEKTAAGWPGEIITITPGKQPYGAATAKAGADDMTDEQDIDAALDASVGVIPADEYPQQFIPAPRPMPDSGIYPTQGYTELRKTIEELLENYIDINSELNKPPVMQAWTKSLEQYNRETSGYEQTARRVRVQRGWPVKSSDSDMSSVRHEHRLACRGRASLKLADFEAAAARGIATIEVMLKASIDLASIEVSPDDTDLRDWRKKVAADEATVKAVAKAAEADITSMFSR